MTSSPADDAGKREALAIPTESDWGNYKDDLDPKWAHDYYLGRSNQEMQAHFANAPFEATDELRFMPEVPFRYYMLGFRDFVLSPKSTSYDAWEAAFCFLNLVEEKLAQQPALIAPIMPDLFPAIEYVAHHQAEFDVDENDNDGSFLHQLEHIRLLYAKNK